MAEEGYKISIGGLILLVAIIGFVYRYMIFIVYSSECMVVTRFGVMKRVLKPGFRLVAPWDRVETIHWTVDQKVYFEGQHVPLKSMWSIPFPIMIDGLKHQFMLTCNNEITDIEVFLNSSNEPMERFYAAFIAVFTKHFQVDKFSWETYAKTMSKVLKELAEVEKNGIVMESINLLQYTKPEEIDVKEKEAFVASVVSELYHKQREEVLEHEMKYLRLMKEKIGIEESIHRSMVHNAMEMKREVDKT